ncbi:protein transport protein Sec31A [Neodiprion virginianus]|uniref:protein transport protein Sec31A n=1 Tax=Neodiprion virginianus TaxID=2961670 RepID=UPI001EE702C4|nr:protein transport protein Sec31A [Neodiprion virginianus]XP_046610184.1 protein transport protein Sec31A [Neodiprion virginianus]
MKVKELLRTVNVAWSPPAQHPILLAAGTAAQQLDASFSTSASLDLYALNLQEPGYDMDLKASISSDHRYHKIIWGSFGNNPAGIIVGGCDYGTIKIYSAAKMLANESDCILSSPDKHTGPVRAMDFNPFQSNLLATGATESEIYIWDLVNTNTPMTPGTRSQPLEDVQYIAWNKQVQHILASTFSQRCVIWDLRKNEPIIKLNDANSRVRWKVVQWHPDVATQLCLASEDDQSPIIQLWDLRFATSPLKTLAAHQRGVLSIAWNLHDPDLLVSCAKDNRILCWNPNSTATNGEVLCELAQTNQWNFDVSWCPRNPGLVAGSSFDGHAVVYSLLGGQQQVSSETSNKIADSFPGMDAFAQAPPLLQNESTVDLKKAPKWLKRPAGASFGFGGKLTLFENDPPNSNGRIIISQVITDPELIHRSNHLEAALQNGQFGDFCKGKADTATSDHNRKVWSCLGAHFGDNITGDILELLGYDSQSINTKLSKFVPEEQTETSTELNKLNNVSNGNVTDGSAAFDAIAQQEQTRQSPASVKPIETNFKLNTGDDEEGLITQAILLGNIEAAVSLCFTNKRYADAVILSMAGGPDLLAKTQYRYFSEHSSALNSLINSLVSEDWGDIVRNCDIKCWKEALVGVFTHSNPEERSALCDVLGDRLVSSGDPIFKRESQFCYICSGNLNKMIEASEEEVQEVVELVTIMQKVLEAQGNIDVKIEGNAAVLLSQYAEMLAAEGNLEAALIYLGNSQEAKIAALRDRLCKALGYIQPTAQQAQPRASIPGQQTYYSQSRRSTQPMIPPQPAYDPSKTAYDPSRAAIPQNNWNTTPTKQTYGPGTNQFGGPQQGQFGTIPNQSIQSTFADQYAPQTYGQLPVVPPVQPPPPPPSIGLNPTGSRPSSVGPQARSKYILDPSVKTSSFGSPYGNQNSFAPTLQTYNNQPQSQVPPIQGFPQQNSFPTQPTVSPNFYSNQQPQLQNLVLNQPATSLTKPSQPNIMNPMQNTAQSSMYNPVSAQPQPPPAQTYSNEISYQHNSQQSGWNDPPNANTSRVQARADSFQPQTPILHPIFGSTPQQEPVPNPIAQESAYSNSHLPYGQQQQYGPPQHIPSQFNPPVESLQPVQSARIAEPEKPKPPIPEEHVHLKTVLDEVRTQCYNNAKNPQIKRKIEEVSRKLEVLYDCLRENKLSPSTLSSLHQMSEMIQSGNYTGGLGLHTQLVSGPDFSQIASFMPGLKVLLQSALQLGVYIR